MSEATRPTSNPAQPIPDYLGAFFTIHIDGFQEILDKQGGWGDALRACYKYLEKHFAPKDIYQSVSECFGFGCDREYLEDTYLVENPLAFNLLQRESGIHSWKVPTAGGDYEFKVQIEVVPLIPTEDAFWRNNKDIKLDTFYTYGAGGPSVVKSLSGVCLTHLPTGISARVTETHAALLNLIYAEKLLASRLFGNELGMLNNTKLVRTVDLTNSIIRNERTGFVSTDIQSFLEGNIHPSL